MKLLVPALLLFVALAGLWFLPRDAPRNGEDPRALPASVAERAAPGNLPAASPSTAAERFASREAVRSAAPAEAPALLRDDESGSVLVLDLDGHVAAEGTAWSFRPDGTSEPALVFGVPSSGRLSLPPGRWDVVAEDPEWTLAEHEGPLDVALGDALTLWVSREHVFTLQVLTPSGEPIADALVRWGTELDLALPDALSESRSIGTTTDASGAAQLRVPSAIGTLTVFAEGFEPESRSLLGSLGADVRIHLHPSSAAARRIRVVDADRSTPLADARVTSAEGPGVEADTDGFLELSSWMLGSELRCEAAGYADTVFRAAWLEEDVLALVPASRVAVRVTRGQSPAAGATLFVSRDDPEELVGYSAVPRQLLLGRDGRTELVVPRGTVLELHALGVDGTQALVEHHVGGPQEELELSLSARSALRVWLIDEDGEPAGSRSRLRVSYARGERPVILSPSDEGAFEVADPERVTRLRAYCPGRVPLNLRPSDGDHERSGEIELRLVRAFDLTIRAVDEADQPVVGAHVTLVDGSTREWFERFPNLRGARPTDHPGWLQIGRPQPGGETDGEGLFLARDVPKGVHEVTASLPDAYTAGGLDADLYPTREQVVWVVATATETILVPTYHRVVIEAFEGTTGAPVSELRILSSFHLEPPRGDGNYWDGWVPQAQGFLEVASPGLATTTVEIDPRDESQRHSIVLWPEDPARIALEGDVEDLIGKPITYDVWTESGEAFLHRFEGRLTVEDPRMLPLFLPFQERCFLSLSVDEEDFSWSFQPERVEWVPGERLPFVAVRTQLPR